MIRSLIAVTLLIGAASANAADLQLGVVCHALAGDPQVTASILYTKHEEPELFKPVYIDIATDLAVVSQTCVMGQNRKAEESSLQIGMGAVPGNPCGATEGPFAVKRLVEIDGTRAQDPVGYELFQAEITYTVKDSGEKFKATLECHILPLTSL
jgi:hypothetical protein